MNKDDPDSWLNPVRTIYVCLIADYDSIYERSAASTEQTFIPHKSEP